LKYSFIAKNVKSNDSKNKILGYYKTDILMIRKFKNIFSLLLLLVFLFPTIVIIEHHHEQNTCNTTNEKQYNVFQEKCGICSFEFSVFSSYNENIDFLKEKPLDHYSNNYNSLFYSSLSDYSFLLRAPPVYTN